MGERNYILKSIREIHWRKRQRVWSMASYAKSCPLSHSQSPSSSPQRTPMSPSRPRPSSSKGNPGNPTSLSRTTSDSSRGPPQETLSSQSPSLLSSFKSRMGQFAKLAAEKSSEWKQVSLKKGNEWSEKAKESVQKLKKKGTYFHLKMDLSLVD